MCVYGALLVFAVGGAHDFIYSYLQSIGVDGGIGTPWDSSQSIWVITALLYFILSLPPVIGLLVFILSVTRRSRRDSYYEAGSIYNQDEGGDW